MHMLSTDLNDFTIRVHLGHLHYGTSIYTTAFAEVLRKDKTLDWIRYDFLSLFA